jgi:hypothetical protein
MLTLLSTYIIPAAYAVLPAPMASPRATALLLAIALQESGTTARRQRPKGPARGFWQFEAGGGITAVKTHPATRDDLKAALLSLRYPPSLTATDLHAIVEHNDVLAAIAARLLLWTLPLALPTRTQGDQGWLQYLDAWRPGAPHPETWGEHFGRAWALVESP